MSETLTETRSTELKGEGSSAGAGSTGTKIGDGVKADLNELVNALNKNLFDHNRKDSARFRAESYGLDRMLVASLTDRQLLIFYFTAIDSIVKQGSLLNPEEKEAIEKRDIDAERARAWDEKRKKAIDDNEKLSPEEKKKKKESIDREAEAKPLFSKHDPKRNESAHKELRIKESALRAIKLNDEQIERVILLKPYIDMGVIDLDRAIKPSYVRYRRDKDVEHKESYISDENVKYLADPVIMKLFGLSQEETFIYTGSSPTLVTSKTGLDKSLVLHLDQFLEFDDVFKERLKDPARMKLLDKKLLFGIEEKDFDLEIHLYKILSLTDKQVKRLGDWRIMKDIVDPDKKEREVEITVADLETMSDGELGLHTNHFLRHWAFYAKIDDGIPRPSLKHLRETTNPEHLKKLKNFDGDDEFFKDFLFEGKMSIEYAASITQQEKEVLSQLKTLIVTYNVCKVGDEKIYTLEQAKKLNQFSELLLYKKLTPEYVIALTPEQSDVLSALKSPIFIKICKVGDEKKYTLEQANKINDLDWLIRYKKLTKKEAIKYTDKQVSFLKTFTFLKELPGIKVQDMVKELNPEFDTSKLKKELWSEARFQDVFLDLVKNKPDFFKRFKELDGKALEKLGRAIINKIDKEVDYTIIKNLYKQHKKPPEYEDLEKQIDLEKNSINTQIQTIYKKCLIHVAFPAKHRSSAEPAEETRIDKPQNYKAGSSATTPRRSGRSISDIVAGTDERGWSRDR